jgi:2-methylcitrate dehydratase PrpD
MGDALDLDRLVSGLGESWEIARNTYKPYPAGIVFHAVIDACFKLRARLNRSIDDIEAIAVQGSALLLARGDRPVRNERDARISIHHCAALALLLGRAGVGEFEEAIVFRPDIVSLRQKVRAERDESLPDGAARVGIHLASGETLSETVMAAKGSLSDPLSDFDIEAKLRDCSRLGGATWNADAIIEDVWRLDELADVSRLMNEHAGFGPAAKKTASAPAPARRKN